MTIIGEGHRVPPSPCQYCGECNDAASAVGSNAEPKPGDVMICINCSGLNVYTDDRRLRRPTPEETKTFKKDYKLQLVRFAVFKLVLERKRGAP